NLGATHQSLGQYPEAQECLTLALDLVREAGDRGSEAEALTRLGAVHLASGRPGEAMAVARSALDLARTVEDAGLEAEALVVLAGALATTKPTPDPGSAPAGDTEPGAEPDADGESAAGIEGAAEVYARATRLAERIRSRRVEVAGLLGLAAVDAATGRP